jgi:hypothetical protein
MLTGKETKGRLNSAASGEGPVAVSFEHDDEP